MDESFNQTKTSKLHPKIGLKHFRLDRCFFIPSTYKHFKSKMHNHQVRQVFRTWDLNQQEFVQRN